MGPLDPTARGRSTRHFAWALTVLLLPVTGLGLGLEGQGWWCAEGDAALWISDIWSSHNSQHVGDPYSLTHFSHGLIFAALFMLPGVDASHSPGGCASARASRSRGN